MLTDQGSRRACGPLAFSGRRSLPANLAPARATLPATRLRTTRLIPLAGPLAGPVASAFSALVSWISKLTVVCISHDKLPRRKQRNRWPARRRSQYRSSASEESSKKSPSPKARSSRMSSDSSMSHRLRRDARIAEIQLSPIDTRRVSRVTGLCSPLGLASENWRLAGRSVPNTTSGNPNKPCDSPADQRDLLSKLP